VLAGLEPVCPLTRTSISTRLRHTRLALKLTLLLHRYCPCLAHALRVTAFYSVQPDASCLWLSWLYFYFGLTLVQSRLVDAEGRAARADEGWSSEQSQLAETRERAAALQVLVRAGCPLRPGTICVYTLH
jgi:hypothetical protein